MQQGLQEGAVKGAQFLAEPVVAGQSLLDIEAVGLAGIKNEAKAQCDNQQRMAQQKATQLSRVEHAFADADQEGFEVGGFGMSRASASRTLDLPLFNDRPIEE